MAICNNCDKKYIPTGTRQKYCSRKCNELYQYKKYHNLKHNVLEKTKYIRTQAHCDAISKGKKGKTISWNKGLTKENTPGLQRVSDFAKKRVKSIEERKKIGDAHRGKKLSLKERKQISINLANRDPISETTRKKLSLAKKGQQSMLGKTQSKETRRKISKGNKGKRLGYKATDETRLKMSIELKRQYANGRTPPFRSGRKYLYNNREFRSSWEVKVAKWLDNNNIKWEYESTKCCYQLNKYNTYIVDFYLQDLDKWIEVKGWWSEKSIKKCNEFVKHNGKEKLIIIDKENINNITLNKYYERNDYGAKL